MDNITLIKTKETPLDLLIYRIIANHKGASVLYQDIVDDLGEALTPTKITRILKGSSSIESYEIRKVHEVLVKYDSSVTLQDILETV